MCVLEIFINCNEAVQQGVLIERPTRSDKEYHFQNWFSKRLKSLDVNFDPPERNTYPDFRLVQPPVGFETKGLEFPGRIADFDCNSQVPAGFHNGRTIYYVFGRYPKRALHNNVRFAPCFCAAALHYKGLCTTTVRFVCSSNSCTKTSTLS